MKPTTKEVTKGADEQNAAGEDASSESSLSPSVSSCSSSSLSLLSIGPPLSSYSPSRKATTLNNDSDEDEKSSLTQAIESAGAGLKKMRGRMMGPRNLGETSATLLAEIRSKVAAEAASMPKPQLPKSKKGKATATGRIASQTSPQLKSKEIPAKAKAPRSKQTSTRKKAPASVVTETLPSTSKATPKTYPSARGTAFKISQTRTKQKQNTTSKGLKGRKSAGSSEDGAGHEANMSTSTPIASTAMEMLDKATNNLSLRESASVASKNVSDFEIDNSIASASGKTMRITSSGKEPTANGEILSCPEIPFSGLEEYPTLKSYLDSKKTGVEFQDVSEELPTANKVVLMEDLDNLQDELETVLTHTVSRSRLLRRERNILDTIEMVVHKPGRRGRRKKVPKRDQGQVLETILPETNALFVVPVAASTPKETLVTKSRITKTRDSSPVPSTSKAALEDMAARATVLPKRPKGRPRKYFPQEKQSTKPKRASSTPKKLLIRSSSNSDLSIPEKPQDTIEAFWESVEAYCRDVTEDDLCRLKDVIDKHDVLPEGIFDIPPLGKHYKDNEETQARKAEEARKLRTRDKVGPLTEKLVSCLVEERVAMFHQSRAADGQEASREGRSGGSGNASLGTPEIFVNRSSLVRALGLDGSAREIQSVPLEARIRECLLDNGLLSPDDPLSEDPDDEILADIKQTQRQLQQLHAYNSSTLRDLYAVAERDLRRNLIKQELDEADEELINVYKAMKGPGYRKKSSQTAADIKKKANEVCLNRSNVVKKLNDFDEETRQRRIQRNTAGLGAVPAAAASSTSASARDTPTPSSTDASRNDHEEVFEDLEEEMDLAEESSSSTPGSSAP